MHWAYYSRHVCTYSDTKNKIHKDCRPSVLASSELTKIDVGFLEAKTPRRGDLGVFDSCSERRTLFDASGTGTASIAFDDVLRCCAVAGMSL
jgi:hypothetical protein